RTAPGRRGASTSSLPSRERVAGAPPDWFWRRAATKPSHWAAPCSPSCSYPSCSGRGNATSSPPDRRQSRRRDDRLVCPPGDVRLSSLSSQCAPDRPVDGHQAGGPGVLALLDDPGAVSGDIPL